MQATHLSDLIVSKPVRSHLGQKKIMKCFPEGLQEDSADGNA